MIYEYMCICTSKWKQKLLTRIKTLSSHSPLPEENHKGGVTKYLFWQDHRRENKQTNKQKPIQNHGSMLISCTVEMFFQFFDNFLSFFENVLSQFFSSWWKLGSFDLNAASPREPCAMAAPRSITPKYFNVSGDSLHFS